jgi:hypothetical protein
VKLNQSVTKILVGIQLVEIAMVTNLKDIKTTMEMIKLVIQTEVPRHAIGVLAVHMFAVNPDPSSAINHSSIQQQGQRNGDGG